MRGSAPRCPGHRSSPQRGPKAGPGVDQRALGIVVRADGTHQVTYDKKPLYLFYKDADIPGITGTKGIYGSGQEHPVGSVQPHSVGGRLARSGRHPQNGRDIGPPALGSRPGVVFVRRMSTIARAGGSSPFEPGWRHGGGDRAAYAWLGLEWERGKRLELPWAAMTLTRLFVVSDPRSASTAVARDPRELRWAWPHRRSRRRRHVAGRAATMGARGSCTVSARRGPASSGAVVRRPEAHLA